MDSTQPNSPDDERPWECGWEDHELQQLRRLAKLTLAQKLQWLEEAHRLVRTISAAKADRKSLGS